MWAAILYREAVVDHSPGLQPWVSWLENGALKVAPDGSATDAIDTPRAEHTSRPPLSGRLCEATNPGLKPWAMVYNRFAVSSLMVSRGLLTCSASYCFVLPNC
jgi:hypothetical protein